MPATKKTLKASSSTLSREPRLDPRYLPREPNFPYQRPSHGGLTRFYGEPKATEKKADEKPSAQSSAKRP